MAKLTGAKKKAFLERMERGRRKAKRANPKKKKPAGTNKAPAKRKPAKKKAPKKNPKLTGARKAAFLKRMAAGRRKAKRTGGKNPSVRKRKKLFNKTFGRAVTREHLAGKKKAAKAHRHGRRGRNPNDLAGAAAMYEKFHQRAPGHILEFEQGWKYPENYAEMGKLKELRFFLDEQNPKFPLTNFGNCLAVSTPDGDNIYFVGGDQTIDLEALGIVSDKDFILLGPCGYIVYDTIKGFHDFRQTNYFHNFGEEDAVFPFLGYDRLNRSLFLLGGNYRVKREGIVN